MKALFPILLTFTATFLYAQNTTPVLDGVVEDLEWKDAQNFTLDYEVDPGDNTPPPHQTKAYIKYTKTDLYVGFIAYADMNNFRSSIRNRDEGFRDDNVLFGFDAYGDGRYMIALGTTPEGNQIDVKVLPNGDDDNYDVNFESKATKHENNYQVELKIPFANLQLNERNKLELGLDYRLDSFLENETRNHFWTSINWYLKL